MSFVYEELRPPRLRVVCVVPSPQPYLLAVQRIGYTVLSRPILIFLDNILFIYVYI